MIKKHISSGHAAHGHSGRELSQAYRLFFSTLMSENRLRIINLLRRGPWCVSDLQRELRLEQTMLSHDLNRMRTCGFVTVHAQGRYRYYSLNAKTIRPLMEIIDRHMAEHCLNIIRKREKHARA